MMCKLKFRRVLREIIQAFAPYAVYAYGTGHEPNLFGESDVAHSNE